MANWEERFRDWAGGPGDTEQERCENAERVIRNAIKTSDELKSLDLEVFSQGSYRNVTNIPQESDVDVAVCLLETMYYEIPPGTEPSQFGIVPSNREFRPYKKAVAKALIDYCGIENVTVGNKAIRVHSNTYHVDADVVANWLFREYFDPSRPRYFRDGVKFLSDDGKWITNYPKQHIEEGIRKNERTSKRFKRVVRVIKRLQAEMVDEKVISDALPSFFIESLVYNVPDDHFGHTQYTDDVRAALAYLFNNTRVTDDPSKWLEANGVKYLFDPTQPWTQAQAHAFVSTAWDYSGFD